MAITSIQSLGNSSTSSSTPSSNPTVNLDANGVSNNNIDSEIKTYDLSSISEFKEAADDINAQRNNVKIYLDDLSKNLYSTINQLNFSVKLIIDTNNFLTKYINTGNTITGKIEDAIAKEPKETTLSMSDDVIFNSTFISTVVFFENFGNMLLSAISDHLVYNNSDNSKTPHGIFTEYCESYGITNTWENFYDSYSSFYLNYKDVFDVTPISVDQQTNSQKVFITEYTRYINIFDNLNTIFENKPLSVSEIQTKLIPAIKAIINFKSGSTLYSNYLDKIGSVLNETISLFNRIMEYTSILINHNTEYQPQFENDNTYISTIISVCSISNELLSALSIKYPNRNSKQGLILDSSFTSVLNTIKNLFLKEIETSSTLIRLASRDYKLIRSLESFITTEKSINNSILFDIMSNFDDELKSTMIKDNNNTNPNRYLGDLITSFIGNKQSDEQLFNKSSFTGMLYDMQLLTEPLYDILNYHRLFMYQFSKDVSLIFDFIEVLSIYDISITNMEITQSINKLFELKLNNVDYVNINPSKINESITSKYDSLEDLNYFNIKPFIDKIEETDLDTITDIAELVSLFENLEGYDLMLFSIIENILYNDIDILLVMKTLSTSFNMRNAFFKIMFTIAIDKAMKTIDVYYGEGNVPDTLTIYTDMKKVPIGMDEELGKDLTYLKSLITANKYYFGNSEDFNINSITDWNNENGGHIWDTNKVPIEKIYNLFNLYKEV